MDRVDSAFNEYSKDSTKQLTEHSVKPRSKMCPRQRRQKTKASDSSTVDDGPAQTKVRQATEKKSSNEHRTSSSRKASIGSSEPSTTHSRRQHPESRHSSRRGAATVIDPSRPARHYRLNSAQTVSIASRDVDDVLALHFRSCSLFSNPSYSAPHPSISGNGSLSSRPSPPLQHLSLDMATSTEKDSSGPILQNRPGEIPNTVMHWTTAETRRKQYEEIDRSNSGIRCLFRKVTPRCVAGPPPQQFYQDDKEDTGSVRRYRMDIPDSDDDEVSDEKSAMALQGGKAKTPKLASPKSRKKKWSCF